MPVIVNLRHLEENSAELKGELSAEELELNEIDELIHTNEPLRYELEAEESGENLLVRGKLEVTLECECVRCLRPFKHEILLEPYALLVPLEGEDKAKVDNDLVDLTPYLREDTLLAFPQHPLCEAECNRLPPLKESQQAATSAQGQKSAWDELNKLKLK